MNISRRKFLITAAGSAAALGVGGTRLLAGERTRSGSASVLQPGGGNPLYIPPTFAGGDLIAAETELNLWPDAATRLRTFNGSYPGPTIRVRSGEMYSMHYINNLGERSNVHHHGLTVPPVMDGHPADTIAPNGDFTYEFLVSQPAATCWYHPHPHGLTAPQVYSGLAGFFLIEDDEEQALGLPSGEYDIPLLIQDRRMLTNRQFEYTLTPDDMDNGLLGDAVLVNGTPDAYLEVARGLYRFRLLNGSNARVMDVAFADNRQFYIIGNDGGLLDKPYPVTYTYIAPGERIEILVDFSTDSIDSSVMLKSLEYGGGSSDPFQQGVEMPIMRFDITRAGQGSTTIPDTLVTLEQLDSAKSARTRILELRMDHSVTEGRHTINNKPYDMMAIEQEVPVGDLEIWTFKNVTFMPHPMHLHGARFQVLDRNGVVSTSPRDFGWKDTVMVFPYQTVRVIVQFPTMLGRYLAHCHNLEHEDDGMMMNFAVVSGLGVKEERGVKGKMNLE